MARVVHRNIAALLNARKEKDRLLPFHHRLAEWVRRFVGSIGSIFAHAVFFGAWIVINVGFVPGIQPFDPFPFVMLAMIASVEAIFLTSFVLLSQDRMQLTADRQAELDLQISLLAEHEVTRLVQMTDAICKHFGIVVNTDDLEELKSDVQPELVLEEIEHAHKEEGGEGAA